MTSFEDACKQVEDAARASSKAALSLMSASKQLEKAAASGDVLQLRKASDSVATAVASAKSAADRAAAAWPFAPHEEEDYLRGEYRNELLEAARSGGLAMREHDDALVLYPLVLRLLPDGKAIRIDRNRITSLRPSALVARLRKLQARKPSVPTERFIEVLYRTYAIVGGSAGLDTLVPLSRIYDALTLFPSTAADYEASHFVRDLFLLETSGIRVTKHGQRIEWVAPSSATREGKGYSFLSPEGETRQYYAVRFVGPKDGRHD